MGIDFKIHENNIIPYSQANLIRHRRIGQDREGYSYVRQLIKAVTVTKYCVE